MNIQELIAEVLDHIRGMWRFRWYALGTSWALALIGWYGVYAMPNIYEATARVSLDTNSLLPALTKGLTVADNVENAVEIVGKALLSRPSLEIVAEQTGLEQRARSPGELESLVTQLQRRVSVQGGRNNVFTISFVDRDRDIAQNVVETLLNNFVSSFLGAQGDDALVTQRALALEVEDHERRLIKAENDLATFKKENIGYMPGDGMDYYGRLQAALASVEATQRQIRQTEQRRDEIARQLHGERPVNSAIGCAQAANISTLRSQLSQLRVDFTDKHPRIMMLRDTIATLEEQCLSESAALRGAGGHNAVPGETNTVYENLRLQLSNSEVELAGLKEQLSNSERQVTQLRADVDKIAEVESSLKNLNRDYTVIGERHQELLRRWEALQSKIRLDPVTDKATFNIVEPPYAAPRPVSPKRALLTIAVLCLALGAGVALAFGLNQLKPVFFTRHSVSRAIGLPVLGSVSMIMSPHQIESNRRRTLLWSGANAVLVAAALALIVYEKPAVAAVRSILTGGGA